RLPFSISAFHGFAGTENHESFDTCFSGSWWFTAGWLVVTTSAADCSGTCALVTSSNAVAVSMELFSCEAAGAHALASSAGGIAACSSLLAVPFVALLPDLVLG